MATPYSCKPNPPLSEECRVASLQSRELQKQDYTCYLSADERTKYMALPSPTRKSEWLAGRLAAKYIFLNRLETARVPQVAGWKPTLTNLSADALGLYPSWMYRQVEVVTDGAKPSLVWCGQARRENVSLSHSGGVSCASLTFGAPTAIDIEGSAPRVAAFYRVNFSDAERRWASVALSRSYWFFTFLWTLKESVVKLGCFTRTSIWNLPGIELEDLPRVNDLGAFSFRNTLSNQFAVFTLTVKKSAGVIPLQVAVTGTRNLTLTVINPLDGVVK